MSSEREHDGVPSDLDGMRDLARAYRADGRDVSGIANGMRSTVRAMEFEGPAADRFEQKLRPRVKELRELAERVEELARLIDDTADEIERERRRRAERGELVAEFVPGVWIGP